jgi:hypothetical protein
MKRTCAISMGVILACFAALALPGAPPAAAEAAFIAAGDSSNGPLASAPHAVSVDGPAAVARRRFDSEAPFGPPRFSCAELSSCPPGVLPPRADSAAKERRTKKGSSRQSTSAIACDHARDSAMKLAKLDCSTSAGVIDSPEFSDCDCNPMGAKALCSVRITYECK